LSEMKEFLATDGSRLAYWDRGEGRPLLFLHGWLMSHKVWAYQLQLCDSFRVVAPDLRGHGESGGDGFSYSGCANDLAGLMNHLELEDAVVVGWSMGAQIALRSLPQLRDRVSAFVLVGGTPCFCSREDYPNGVPLAEARGMALRLRRGFSKTAGEFYRGMFSPEDERSNDIGSMAKTVVGRLPQLQVALDALDELVNSDLRSQLQDVDLPVLLLHGDADRICPSGASHYMYEHLPDSRLQLFHGAGHAPFLTRTAEFNSLLSELAGGVR